MEKDDLRELAKNAIRAPFRINMTGGESFEVRHRDFITVSEYYAAVVVPKNGEDSIHMLTLVNISTIDMLPKEVEKGSNGIPPGS